MRIAAYMLIAALMAVVLTRAAQRFELDKDEDGEVDPEYYLFIGVLALCWPISTVGMVLGGIVWMTRRRGGGEEERQDELAAQRRKRAGRRTKTGW